MKIKNCAKYAARLNDEDTDALVTRTESYMENGLSQEDAQRLAAKDTLAELERDLKEIFALAKRARPELFRDMAFSRGVVAEVAPNPDQKDVFANWSEMTIDERITATRAEGKRVARFIMDLMGQDGWNVSYSTGSFEGQTNPNFIIEAPENASDEQVEEFSRLVGFALDQKAMVTFDENTTTGDNLSSWVKIQLPEGMPPAKIDELRKHLREAGFDGDTLRDGALHYGNFSGISDEDFKKNFDAAAASFEFDGTATVSPVLRYAGQYIQPDTRDGYLERTRYEDSSRQGSGQEQGRDVLRDTGGPGRDLDALRRFADETIARREAWIDNSASGRTRAIRHRSESRRKVEGKEFATEYGAARERSVSAVGVHYSQRDRSTLTTAYYGTGLKGAERERLQDADPRLRKRLYFYVDTGKGITPEAGVGGSPHSVKLNNLYDTEADLSGYLKLAKGDANKWERLILEGGYDGYLADTGGQQDFAVLLGDHTIPYPRDKGDATGEEAGAPTMRYSRGIDRDAEKWAQSILSANKAPVDDFVYKVMDAPPVPMQMFGLGRSLPVTMGANMVRHLRNAGGKDSVRQQYAAQMIGAASAGIEKPRAVISYTAQGGVVRYEAILDWRDANQSPLLVSLRKETLRAGQKTLSIADIHTLYTKERSLAYVLAHIKDGSKVWLAEEEVARVRDFTDEGPIPYGAQGAVPPRTSSANAPSTAPLRSKDLEVSQATTSIVYGPRSVVKYQQGGSGWQSETEDIRVTDADVRRAGSMAFARNFDTPTESKLDDLIYRLQDKQIDLKRVVEGITSQYGQVSDHHDAYLRESLFHGRVAARANLFADTELDPLQKLIKASGASVKDVDDYLWARHAPERNKYYAAINPDIDPADRDSLSGLSDQEAAQKMADILKRFPAMPQIAARVDSIIAGTRDLMESYGLETPETVDKLRTFYKHYVPLHREDQEGTGMPPSGTGFRISGSTVKRGTGSRLGVENVLAHVIAEREAIITRGEKNIVGLSLYALALQHPEPSFWKADVVPKIKALDERKQVWSVAQGKMIPNPNLANGQPTVIEKVDPTYRDAQKNPHIFLLKVNGEERMIQFNSRDERALRMAQALQNLDAVQTIPGLATATHWLAAVNTQYNPVFLLTNAIRDIQGALLNLSTTPIADKRMRVLKDSGAALKAIWNEERERGSGGTWGDIYRDFEEHGGKTGFRDAYADIEDRAKKLQKEIDKADRGITMKAAYAIAEVVADSNTAVENAIRVSAYKAALDAGMSKDKAASLAKELTVNFNRKGQLGGYAGSLFAFFNSAVQGNARTLATLAGPAGKKIIAGGLMLGVAQALMLEAGDDEDRKEAIKAYEKDKNTVFRIGGTLIKIPMPLGFHLIPATSRMLTEMAIDMAKGKELRAGSRLADWLKLMLEGASPVSGHDIWAAVTPTVADIPADLLRNKDGLGNPIYQERFPDDVRPGYKMARDSTSPVWKWTAEKINNATGGDSVAQGSLSPQPESMRYIVESVFGGIWRETERAVNFATDKAVGRETDFLRLPFLSRFAGDLDSNSAPSDQYYKNKERMKPLAKYDRVLDSDKSSDEEYKDAKKGLKESRFTKIIDDYKDSEKALRELRKERRELTIESVSKNAEKINKIEEEMAEEMRRFNKLFRETEQGAR